MSTSVIAESFRASYGDARDLFLERCAGAGARVASHAHPLPGPDGAALFLDEARFGPDDARRVLFVASGTHGVEGYCGSGIQSFLLADGCTRDSIAQPRAFAAARNFARASA